MADAGSNGGNGGEGGIRTHGTRKGTTVFETAPFDHSGTSPRLGIARGARKLVTGTRLRKRQIASGGGARKPPRRA